MKLLKCVAFTLALTGALATTIQPASADEMIWVMPSGCIGINSIQQVRDPWPWIFPNSIYTYIGPDGRRYQVLVYRNKPYPTPDEFVGAVLNPGSSPIWQAPPGANTINRSLNCMLSNGGSQG